MRGLLKISQTQGINLPLLYPDVKEREHKLTLRARVLGDRRKLPYFNDFTVFVQEGCLLSVLQKFLYFVVVV